VKISHLLLFSSIFLFTIGCSKKGCSDPDSIDYERGNSSGNEECRYQGSLVFWYGKDVSEFLIENNVSGLNFYLNDELVGTTETKNFRTNAPDCDDFSNAVKTTRSLGNVKTIGYEFSVQSEDNITIWHTSININANTCSTLELGL